METKAAAQAVSLDPNVTTATLPVPSAPSRVAMSASSDLRLIIEEDQASGAFVYKTIDRRTGEVVAQFPRDQVLRLREVEDYSAGDVIRSSV
jgi:flagellar protein FlaG